VLQKADAVGNGHVLLCETLVRRGPTLSRMVVLTSNEWLISCKRLLDNLWSTAPLGGRDADGVQRRPRLSAALAG
jgi:hypothetical protein